MTGNAVANQVAKGVCLFVPSRAEQPKCLQVMHDRSAPQFGRRLAACRAGLFVASPYGAARAAPAWSVIFGPKSAAPVRVSRAGWRLRRKPGQPAFIAAEAAPVSQVPSADAVVSAAGLARAYAEPALSVARMDALAGFGARCPVVARLANRQREHHAANGAGSRQARAARAGHSLLDHNPRNARNAAETRRKRKASGDLFE